MATCPACGSTVALGGYKDGNRRYCNKKCYALDEVNRVADKIPPEEIEQFAKDINAGKCPKCSGAGPVDIHKSYSIYSIILYTSWKTNEHMVCKKCASKQQIADLIGSALLGWWGIPFGLIVTPIQIISNIIAILRKPGIDGPTSNLKERTKLILASRIMEKNPQ